MKFIKTILLLFILVAPQVSLADLSNIEKLSCEAILCLSTGGPPHECDPALNYFKSLKAKKWKNTFKKRRKFLDICPDTDSVSNLKDVLAAGAFRCDKNYLLTQLNPVRNFDGEWDYGPMRSIPSYCKDYYNHSYTRLGQLPRRSSQCRWYNSNGPVQNNNNNNNPFNYNYSWNTNNNYSRNAKCLYYWY